MSSCQDGSCGSCDYCLDQRPDPNEGNPFEPPETSSQRDRRVGAMIRKNVDDGLSRKATIARLAGELLEEVADASLGRKVLLDNLMVSLSNRELDYLVKKLGAARVQESLVRSKR